MNRDSMAGIVATAGQDRSRTTTIVAARDGVALAELTEAVPASGGGARPEHTSPVHRLAVIDANTGEPLGQATWHSTGHGPAAADAAWDIGLVLDPGARGQGVGVVATRLLVEHLFATTDLDRVQASTDRDNGPAQRVLAKAGLRREGVLRGAQSRDGERRDMVAFGVLRSDLVEPDPDADREVAASGEGIVLAELLSGELELLRDQDDGAYDVDRDDRPMRHFPDVHRFAVLDRHTEELLGSVSWHAVGYGASAGCEAWNCGISLLPQSRGRGAGATALRLLAEYLLAATDVDRIEASTDRENVPAQRALAKAGFRAEGLIRGAQLRGGRRHDMLAYSMLRSDVAEPAETPERATVVVRDGVALVEPGPGDREQFYIAGSGEFAVDQDNRPRVSGPAKSSLLSVVDVASGDLLGGVSWHAVDYGGTVSSSAWNIGIGLLPEARGRGVGTTAQRLLVEYLLATTELDRIEASTDVDNTAEQRALEKAGFRREGVLRGAQLRGGVRRDLVHYGLVRGDLAN